MKPAMSVTVVSTIDEAVAGSWPTRVRPIGTSAPANPAATIDSTIEIAMTNASPIELDQISTPIPVVARAGRRCQLNEGRSQLNV